MRAISGTRGSSGFGSHNSEQMDKRTETNRKEHIKIVNNSKNKLFTFACASRTYSPIYFTSKRLSLIEEEKKKLNLVTRNFILSLFSHALCNPAPYYSE